MKKFLLTVLSIALSFGVFAQTAEKTAQNSANPDISAAQKATLELVKAYDLSGEQAQATLKIEQAKVQNLVDIEPMKAADMSAYAQKRLSAMDIAASEFSTLLDARQLNIFKQAQVNNATKIANITQGLRKQGVSEAEINKQLVLIELGKQ
ncbi:MAG: hypothetical protein U5L45_13635 [Saprospiraceae bacterium]|nr:hypothetical protein [Saprospiraceae bacterium]